MGEYNELGGFGPTWPLPILKKKKKKKKTCY